MAMLHARGKISKRLHAQQLLIAVTSACLRLSCVVSARSRIAQSGILGAITVQV